MQVSDAMIRAAATALANGAGGRSGVPPVSNVLDMLPARIRERFLEDAKAAIEAALAVKG